VRGTAGCVHAPDASNRRSWSGRVRHYRIVAFSAWTDCRMLVSVSPPVTRSRYHPRLAWNPERQHTTPGEMQQKRARTIEAGSRLFSVEPSILRAARIVPGFKRRTDGIHTLTGGLRLAMYSTATLRTLAARFIPCRLAISFGEWTGRTGLGGVAWRSRTCVRENVNASSVLAAHRP